MVTYTCENCNRTFSQKSHYDNHQSRKRPCKKDNTIEALVEKKVKEALAQKIDLKPATIETDKKDTMDYSKKTREELIAVCKEKGIKGYSGKKKDEIVKLLSASGNKDEHSVLVFPEKIHRLNYIGSKFQLLDWITDNIREQTGWSSFADKTIADLFAGTGIVSYHFRKNMARVISNDAELYSSIITHAFTRSIYTEKCKKIIDKIQKDIQGNKHSSTVGFVTTHYSPHGSNQRKFFTVEMPNELIISATSWR